MLLFLLPMGFAITLQEAISIAQKQSPSLQIQEHRLQQAKIAWPQTLTLISPKIFFNANYTRNQKEIAFSTTDFLTDLPDFIEIPESSPTVIQPLNAQSWSASLVQPILDAKTPGLLRAAKAQIRSAQHQKKSHQREFTISFAELFVRKQLLDQNLQLLAEQQQLVNESLQIANEEYEAGKIPLQEKLSAQIQQRTTSIQILQLQNQAWTVQQQLEQRMGQSLSSALQNSPLRQLPSDMNQAIVEAQKNRSEMRAIQEDIQRIWHQKRARYFEWLPIVESNFNYSFANNIAFSDQNTLWSIQVKANWLLWDGGSRVQQHRMDQLQYAIRNIEQQQLETAIETEVTNEWRKRELLLSQQEKARLDQNSAALNLKGIQQGHENQVIRDRDLRQAKLLLSQSNYLYVQLESELYLQNFKILMLCYESAFAP